MATSSPVALSIPSHTIAIPPFPRQCNFLKPFGHLFPNVYFSWSEKITYFAGGLDAVSAAG